MAMAEQDFPEAQWYYGMDQGRGEIVYGPDSASKALMMLYPADTFGPHENGLQIKAVLQKGVDTAWAAYTVMFQEGFDFVKGGKLPGLCGGACVTGGNTPDGTNGWSARIMWRSDGNSVQYMYFPENEGVDLPWNYHLPQKRFLPGEWHTVVTRIIMNTPGSKDGSVYSWFDGELALVAESLMFRTAADLDIDVFYLSTFFGGSGSIWAPPKDVSISYGSFEVTADQFSPKPQALFWISQNTGTVPFTLHTNATHSMGRGLSHNVDFGNGSTAQSSEATTVYAEPGVYTLTHTVTDTAGLTSENSTRIIAIDSTDGLTSKTWQGVFFNDTITTSDSYLNMTLTWLDTGATTIHLGPSITGEAEGEWSLFGALRIEDGIASPLDYTERMYDVENGIAVTRDAIRVSFQMNFDASPMTYSVWVNGHKLGDEYRYRGYAKSISHYGFHSLTDYAAILSNVSVGDSIDDGQGLRRVNADRKKLSASLTLHHDGGTIIFSTNSQHQNTELKIYNLRGTLVQKVVLTPDSQHQITDLTSGSYLYQTTVEGVKERGSFILQR